MAAYKFLSLTTHKFILDGKRLSKEFRRVLTKQKITLST